MNVLLAKSFALWVLSKGYTNAVCIIRKLLRQLKVVFFSAYTSENTRVAVNNILEYAQILIKKLYLGFVRQLRKRFDAFTALLLVARHLKTCRPRTTTNSIAFQISSFRFEASWGNIKPANNPTALGQQKATAEDASQEQSAPPMDLALKTYSHLNTTDEEISTIKAA